MPFPLAEELPVSLVGIILDFLWDLDRLHALPLPSELIDFSELAWHLELPYWRDPNGRVFAISPLEVRSHPDRFSDQYQRTMRADLEYPIHILSRDDRWVILDGVHRLLKARLLGRETIQAKKVPASVLAEIALTG